MKHIITLIFVMFSLLAYADDEERKDRRDERQEDRKNSIKKNED